MYWEIKKKEKRPSGGGITGFFAKIVGDLISKLIVYALIILIIYFVAKNYLYI